MIVQATTRLKTLDLVEKEIKVMRKAICGVDCVQMVSIALDCIKCFFVDTGCYKTACEILKIRTVYSKIMPFIKAKT